MEDKLNFVKKMCEGHKNKDIPTIKVFGVFIEDKDTGKIHFCSAWAKKSFANEYAKHGMEMGYKMIISENKIVKEELTPIIIGDEAKTK